MTNHHNCITQFEELQIKQNILQAFIQVKETEEAVVDKATGEL
jgi:hypothetical protein